MNLITIKLTNFRSFREEVRFDFPAGPGLYFLQGINEAEPRLGPNGAGKSTIWDALCWCLYGKTPRGLKAGDINNWEAGKGTVVELIFEDKAGVHFTVRRTWGPISWTLRINDVVGASGDFDDTVDLVKDKTNQILALLRLEYQPFLQAVLMAQGQPMFLDLKHDAQAALFSEVMGLDRWLDYSAKASKRASAQDAISRDLERRLSDLKGQLAATGRNDFALRSKDWEAEQRARIATIEADYQKELNKCKRIKQSVEVWAVNEDEARLSYQKRRQALAEPLALLKTAQVLLDELERNAERLLATVEADERFMDELCQRECPTCGHTMSDAESREATNKAQAELSKHVDELNKHNRTVERGLAEVKALKRQVEQLEGAELSASDDMEAAIRGRADARRALQLSERELDRMEESVEALQAEVNPFEALQRNTARDAERLADELDAAQRLLDDSNGRYSLFSFWVRGFKELRLQLIAEALNELEIEVNSCVAALGLVDWELTFAVDRETKGGGIHRGFSVMVKSPTNRAAVPWEAWSGGETQRLRIAGNMGLGDLIRSRTGADLGLEVWDEPTQGLSDQGITDLLESLAARARHENRQIWIVDHHAHNFGAFAGGATIVKTRKGSVVR